MCYQMLPIAVHDEQHFIGQCEHGTLHLKWGRLVLSLHPNELLLIARTVQRYDPASYLPLVSPSVSLLWSKRDIAQVWLANVGLYLDCEALTILLTLITEASQYIEMGKPLLNQHDLSRKVGYRSLASLN